MNKRLKLFLNYAVEDRKRVYVIYEQLCQWGYSPWFDDKDLIGGESWEQALERAVKSADFFIALLSQHSVNKRGYVQREQRFALNIWNGMLGHDIYLIPLRLEECTVPEQLAGFQYIDMFKSDGYDRLKRALKEGEQRRITTDAERKVDGDKIDSDLPTSDKVQEKNMPLTSESLNIGQQRNLGYNDLTFIGSNEIASAAQLLGEIKGVQDDLNSAVSKSTYQLRLLRDVSASTRDNLLEQLDNQLGDAAHTAANALEIKAGQFWQHTSNGMSHLMKALLLRDYHKSVNKDSISHEIERLTQLLNTLEALSRAIPPSIEEWHRLIAGNSRLQPAGRRLISVTSQFNLRVNESIVLVRDYIQLYRGLDTED